MIKQALIFFLTSLLLSISLPVLAADQKAEAPSEKKEAAQPTVPMSTVLQNLKMNGYELITKVELDDGVFHIKALTPQGEKLNISMNATSGEITSPKKNPIPQISLAEAVRKVETGGYHDLFLIEFNGSKYVVKALDQKDKKIKLKVDAESGEISKPWF